uniref:Alternative protein NEURL n=1 Tax=Homo sapiens TaxID=9606 RepID=L8EA77_HUMAN|nr:alternative protein NEURL [Homo sapiens]
MPWVTTSPVSPRCPEETRAARRGATPRTSKTLSGAPSPSLLTDATTSRSTVRQCCPAGGSQPRRCSSTRTPRAPRSSWTSATRLSRGRPASATPSPSATARSSSTSKSG